MTVLVQLSDCHVGAIDGGDPLGDLRAAVAAVRSMRHAPDAVLVSGDLVEHGDPQEYVQVREALEPLSMPVHVLPGNHDDRRQLRRAFPLSGVPTADPLAPYHYGVDVGDLRLLVCDSSRPGRPDGALGPEQLRWLKAALTTASGRPAVVAMHHPPVQVGMPALDEIGLAVTDREALQALPADPGAAVRVVSGHVHMAAVGQLGGRVVVTCPSTWRHRPALELGSTVFHSRAEPAGLLVHVLIDGRLVTHVQPLEAAGADAAHGTVAPDDAGRD